MFCTNCGTVVDDKAVFCMNCGAKLQPKESAAAPVEEPVAAAVQTVAPATAVETTPAPEAQANILWEEPVINSGVEAQPVQTEAPVTETPAEPVAPAVPVVPVEPVFTPKPVAPHTIPVAAPVVSVVEVPAAPAEKPTSVWMYLLMILLNGLPVVGLIAHIIALAVSKKKSFKNYCCAMVILGIISLLLVIAGVVVGYVFLDELNELLAEFNIMIEPLF